MKMQRLITIIAVLAISIVLGEENQIEILKVEECFDSASISSDATMNWSIKEEENDKLLSFTFEIKEPVDLNELRSEISVYHPSGNDGDYELILTTEGSVCNYITKVFKEEWSRIKVLVEPPLEDDCLVPKGRYKLDSYKLNPENTNLPKLLPKGPLRLEIVVQQKDDVLTCLAIELKTL